MNTLYERHQDSFRSGYRCSTFKLELMSRKREIPSELPTPGWPASDRPCTSADSTSDSRTSDSWSFAQCVPSQTLESAESSFATDKLRN